MPPEIPAASPSSLILAAKSFAVCLLAQPILPRPFGSCVVLF